MCKEVNVCWNSIPLAGLYSEMVTGASGRGWETAVGNAMRHRPLESDTCILWSLFSNWNY